MLGSRRRTPTLVGLTPLTHSLQMSCYTWIKAMNRLVSQGSCEHSGVKWNFRIPDCCPKQNPLQE